MAVNQIKISGALKLKDDIFKYFKDSLLDSANFEEFPELDYPVINYYNRFFHKPVGSVTNPEPIYNTIDPTSITLPISRGTFYDYCDAFMTYPNIETYVYANELIVERIGFFAALKEMEPIYTRIEPESNWSFRQLNDWGRILTIELALFGNVKFGVGRSDMSRSFGGATLQASVSQWEQCSLEYLRLALKHFDSYGNHRRDGEGLILDESKYAPSNVTVDANNRTFSFQRNGYYGNKPNYYEYSAPGREWTTVQSFTDEDVRTDEEVGPGDLEVRMASDTVYSSSLVAVNTGTIPANRYVITVNVLASFIIDINNPNYKRLSVNCSARAEEAIPTSVSLNIRTYFVQSGNPSGLEEAAVISITIPSGNTDSHFENFLGTAIGPKDGYPIFKRENTSYSPTSTGGTDIILEYTPEPQE